MAVEQYLSRIELEDGSELWVLYSEGLNPQDVPQLIQTPFYLYVALLRSNLRQTAFFGSCPGSHESFLEAIKAREIKPGENCILFGRAQAQFHPTTESVIHRITLHEKPGFHEQESIAIIQKMFQLIDHALLSPEGVYVLFNRKPYLFYNPTTRQLSVFGQK